jgi:hypothetical protein
LLREAGLNIPYIRLSLSDYSSALPWNNRFPSRLAGYRSLLGLNSLFFESRKTGLLFGLGCS